MEVTAKAFEELHGSGLSFCVFDRGMHPSRYRLGFRV